MSIHIGATKGQIAEAVLLPGDPLRAQYLAETYLENPECYNQVRGMLGFTGTYNGKKVSVQGTGHDSPGGYRADRGYLLLRRPRLLEDLGPLRSAGYGWDRSTKGDAAF